MTKIKILSTIKSLEDEVKRGNYAALKLYIEEQVAHFEHGMRYAKGETFKEYQGVLRTLDDILELLP